MSPRGKTPLLFDLRLTLTREPRRSESGEPVTVEGVSLVAAAVSAWDGLAAFEPDIVLSVGTAGGVKALGAVKGQV